MPLPDPASHPALYAQMEQAEADQEGGAAKLWERRYRSLHAALSRIVKTPATPLTRIAAIEEVLQGSIR